MLEIYLKQPLEFANFAGMFKDKADILFEIAKLHDFRKDGHLRYRIL